MRRKLLSIVLALTMALGLLPAAALAEGEGSGTDGATSGNVAKIGETEYATLADAIATVTDYSETPTEIVLINDATGGVKIGAENQKLKQNIVLNLNNHTYNVKKGVGSTGTETNGIQLLLGSKCVIKNGIMTTDHTVSNFLIKNYCDLTLENVYVDGSNVTTGNVTINNCGTLTVKGDADKMRVTAPTNGYAITTGNYVPGTTPTTTIENGTIDSVYTEGSFWAATTGETVDQSSAHTKILGGKIGSVGIYYWDEAKSLKWTFSMSDDVEVSQINDFTAKIGNSYYATLAAAVAAAPTDGTETEITLLKSVTGGGFKTNDGQNVVIDLNGNTFTSGSPTVGSAGTETNGFQFLKGSKVTFKNGRMDLTTSLRCAYLFQNYADLTLEDVNVDISMNRACEALVHSMHGKVNIIGNTNLTSGDTYYWNYNDQGDKKVIKVADWNNESYSDGTQVTVDTSGTISGIVRTTCIVNDKQASSRKSTLTINNGHFDSALSIDSDDNYVAPTITINGGMFDAALPQTTEAKGTLIITGGLFTSDPSAYCVDGKTGVASNNAEHPWTVGEKVQGAVDATVAAATVPAKLPENVSDSIKRQLENLQGAAMDSTAAEAAAKTEAASNTIGADTEVGDTDKTVTDLLNEAVQPGTTIDKSNVAIVYQSYIDMVISGVTTGTSGITGLPNITELSIELTPMYRVVATTTDVVNNNKEIVIAGENTSDTNPVNGVVVQEGKKLNVPEGQYEISFELPQSFSVSNGEKLSIKHTKENGTVEYYTGTVQIVTSGNSSKKILTFTTNGFSPFVISTAAAFIGETAYPTLQEAADAASDGATIQVRSGASHELNFTATKSVNVANETANEITVKFNGTDKTVAAGKTETFAYTRPSSSSSGSTRYNVTVDSAEHGSVSAGSTRASRGATVTLTVKPDSGYVLETLTVLDKNGKEVAVTEKDGKYTFTMPAGDVTVKAAFMEDNTVLNFFYDVPNSAYYYDAVKWAVEKGVTSGIGDNLFGPDAPCTRAQIVTFLWKAAGSPVVNYAMSFSDVAEGAWYAEAVRWAVSEGITSGTSDATFSPDASCTRAQAAVFLYRYVQTQGKGFTGAWMFRLPFTDVPEWAYESVAWCYMNGVTAGVSDQLFGADNACTRAQIVTFLFKACQVQ